jgi:hypothetical protein
LRVPLVRKSLWGRRPSDVRQASNRSVLLAALNTQFYGRLLESAGLGTPEEIAGLISIEEALARLPRSEPGYVRMDSRAMINWDAPAGGVQDLFWPLPPASRTAVLAPGFRWRPGVKTFRRVTSSRLARFGPEALAGPVSELRRLADRIADGWGRMRPLRHSVLAFVTLRQAFLSDEARETFWRVFKAPVFGQIFGLSRELLAWECEAHEGYHLCEGRSIIETDCHGGEPELLVTSLVGLRRPAIRLATGLTGNVEDSACGCGKKGPRLVNLRLKSVSKFAVAAASAA